MIPKPYEPEHPSLITLQVRVQMHPVDLTRMDIEVSGMQVHNLPGGWSSCHKLLLDAAKAAHVQAVKEVQAQKSVIEVAQTVPINGGLA